jgi:hypothetical protein
MVLLQNSMRRSLVFLHVVGTFEDLETLRALGWLSVHVLHSDVAGQVYLCYQLVAMWTGFLACK